jgi:hypothetical protein
MWMMRKYRHFGLRPGSYVFYDGPGEAQNIPKQIQDIGNFQIGDDAIKTQRNTVERHFHTEFFQLVTRLTKENTGSWPTATQILQVEGEQARQLAPKIGRFTNVLRECDTRCMDIKQRMGELPEPPDIVLEYMGYLKERGETELDVQVEFVGPLMVIQQRAENLGRSEEALSIIERYSALDPTLASHKTRLSVLMERDLEAIRCPQDAIVSEDEYMDSLARMAQEEQAEKEALMLAEGAKAVPGLSKKVEEGSILGELGKGAA